jgi:hypothetical protein
LPPRLLFDVLVELDQLLENSSWRRNGGGGYDDELDFAMLFVRLVAALTDELIHKVCLIP